MDHPPPTPRSAEPDTAAEPAEAHDAAAQSQPAERPTAPAAPEPPAPPAPPTPPARTGATPETAWSVKDVANRLKGYIDKLGAIWIEGQLVELTRRPGSKLAYAVLRDPNENYSVSVHIFTSILEAFNPPLASGSRVVINAKANFWPVRGSLSFQARDIRRVGIGEMLARIERLKRALAAEGLFAPARKKPLPAIPGLIGLIAGRASDAARDVIVNTEARFPAARFEIREVAVQGERAPAEIIAALAELDAHPEVDVIVIARGGGAFEDLVVFSDETIIRAVAAAKTPVVSAIGHENDSPLLDLVADVRASTPTDAAKRIAPDVAEECTRITQSRTRLTRALRHFLDGEAARLAQVRSRPVLARPAWIFEARDADLAALRADLTRAIGSGLTQRTGDIRTLAAALAALSPQGTLDRGYGIVRDPTGAIVRDADLVAPGQTVHIRLARGELTAKRQPSEPAAPTPSGQRG